MQAARCARKQKNSRHIAADDRPNEARPTDRTHAAFEAKSSGRTCTEPGDGRSSSQAMRSTRPFCDEQSPTEQKAWITKLWFRQRSGAALNHSTGTRTWAASCSIH